MSVLDQLFSVNPELTSVDTAALTEDEVISLSTAQAAHQAMRDGMVPQDQKIDTSLSPMPIDAEGSINILSTINVAKEYQNLLVQDQLQDPRFTPTADDVFDGGMKNGSKVIIQVSGSGKSLTSWDASVRSRIAGQNYIPVGLYFDKFSVMSISEPHEERYQIHETFGADIIQGFGSRPVIITLSGQILNGRCDVRVGSQIVSMDWKNALFRFYKEHFSLTACLKKKKRCRIFAQDTIYYGYFLGFNESIDSENQSVAQISMSFVLARKAFSKRNDDRIPGLQRADGFRIPGKTVPTEYFASPRNETFFRKNFSKIQQSALISEQQKLDILLARLLKYFNTGSRANYPAPGEKVQITQKFSMYDYLDGSKLYIKALEIDKRRRELDAKIIAFNEKLGYRQQKELIYNPGADYDKIVKEQSDVRLQERGLLLAINKSDELCLEIKKTTELIKELQR